MPTEIDLWLWPLDRPDDEVRALAGHLDPVEQARRDRYVKPHDAARFAVGRGRLREILASYVGGRPSALPLHAAERGKPGLRGGPAFNLSHADGWAALAVSAPDLPLGIDIEAFRTVEPGVAERFFAPAEVADLARLCADDWSAGFFRCWTRKEAVVKATGLGLGCDLTSFRVALLPGQPCAMLAAEGQFGPASAWSLAHLDLSPRFPGAIAARNGGDPLRIVLREGSLPVGEQS